MAQGKRGGMNSIAVQGIQDCIEFQNTPSFEKGGLGRIKNA